VSLSVFAARLLVRLYPARTRSRFGDDLIDVTSELIEAELARGGTQAVPCLWPRLLADFGAALASEYRDLWCERDFGPERFAFACLVTSSAVWMTIAAATVLDQRWAASALDASLTVTMLLAFGLPAVALLASRLRPGKPRWRVSILTPLRIAAAATFSSWSLLAFHLVRHG
jgi:hypothetical protein